ncbi:hypothetical protein QL285_004891 [Trifolium repens]|nr:hypothetical protein QL285_004891 [Trifolium repens]
MEGYRSISVTHMGGNMAILRSSMEGDVARLLRSKNECLKYYFSDLKPWNPGLLAIQREVWVQVYDIPLHIWGENLFKLVGNNLGEFLDFDEETARMARFDMARIKILSQTWAFIDVVQKVEVEGVIFEIWVVEERGRQRSEVVLYEEREEEGSRVVPADVSDKVEESSGEGADGSGSDDMSGDELEVDGRGFMLHGEEHEVGCDSGQCDQVPKEGNVILTCEKSTNPCNSQMEILSVPLDKGVRDTLVIGQKVQEVLLVDNTTSEDNGCQEVGGARAIDETVFLKQLAIEGGPQIFGGPPSDGVGLSKPISDPMYLDPNNPAQMNLDHPTQIYSDPHFMGRLVEEDGFRCSSFSEPEEVLSPHRSKATKPNPKMRRNKSCSKFNQLGVPRCIKLAEAIKEAGGRAKKIRRKGIGAVRFSDGDEPEDRGEGLLNKGSSVEVSNKTGGGSRRQDKKQACSLVAVTPNSGLCLLSGSDVSIVPESLSLGNGGD